MEYVENANCFSGFGQESSSHDIGKIVHAVGTAKERRMMNTTLRNFLIVLFTAGIILGTLILAVDSMSTSGTVLESTSQINAQAQPDSQSTSGQIVANEGSSTSNDVIAMVSRMGVVALIIVLVFLVQMVLVWMLRKPAQAVRW
jgi:hypothetical protein